MGKKEILEQFSQFEIPTYEMWRKVTEESLKGAYFEKLLTHTYEEITLQPMYQRKDIEDLEFIHSLPGEAPFVRGTKKIHQQRPWEISQELDMSTPEEFNETALYDLNRGQTVLNIVVDEVTKEGKNAAEMEEQAGVSGLSISSVQDVEVALKNIDLNKIPLHIHAGALSLPLFSQILAYAQKSGQAISGCIGMDPLGELVKKGSLPCEISECYKIMADVTKWAKENAPELATVIVDSSPYHNGGANAVQELAFALATAVHYLDEMTERGISIDEAATSIRFIFSIGANFFMEIAKLRAARMLWSKIVAAFGGNEESQKMYIHARTSKWTKTKYDPYVNMLRSTSEAFAAAVGGADSIHVTPFDEPLQKSTSFSRRIARNTSIILQEEAQIGKTFDPAGGSWYVEKLTDELAQKAWSLFQEIEKRGGIVSCLQQGYVQELVRDIREKRLKNIDLRKDVFVGTNMYANIGEKPIEAKHEDDRKRLKEHIERVRTYKRVSVKLPDENKTEEAIQAAKNGATLADITDALALSAGKLKIEPIIQTRATAKFEELRDATEKYASKNGSRPKVFLANLGPIPKHKARSDFAASFVEVAGFQAVRNDGFHTAEDAVQSALESGAEITIICGNDESYEQYAKDVVAQIKARMLQMTVWLAKKPLPEEIEAYKKAGVDDFIYLGANCYEMMRKLQMEKGVASA